MTAAATAWLRCALLVAGALLRGSSARDETDTKVPGEPTIAQPTDPIDLPDIGRLTGCALASWDGFRGEGGVKLQEAWAYGKLVNVYAGVVESEGSEPVWDTYPSVQELLLHYPGVEIGGVTALIELLGSRRLRVWPAHPCLPAHALAFQGLFCPTRRLSCHAPRVTAPTAFFPETWWSTPRRCALACKALYCYTCAAGMLAVVGGDCRLIGSLGAVSAQGRGLVSRPHQYHMQRVPSWHLQRRRGHTLHAV